MDNATLSIILKAIDDASPVLNQVGQNIDKLAKNNAGLSDTAKQGAQIVSTAFLAIGAATIAAAGYSAKMATDFQTAMTLIQTQAGASSQEVKNMSSSILDLAGQVGDTPIQLANALFPIESVGLRGAKALDALKIAAEGAKVGQADLTSTTNTLTSIISSGIKGAQDYGQAMGSINAIIGAGKMHMEDFNSALSTGILATAKNLGISLPQVGAGIDTLVNSGMNATDAATRLNSTLQMMTNNTPKVTSALAEIGLSQKQLFNDMQSGGIQKVLQDFNTGLNQTSAVTEAVTGKTKLTATAIATLKNNIANTQTQLDIYSQQHVKAGAATEAHNLKITKAKETLAGYQEKLDGATGSLKAVGGASLDAAGKAQIIQSIFGVRESTSFNSLLSHSKEFDASLNQINKSTNNFQEQWQTTSQTSQMAFDKLAAQLQVLAIRWGDMLLPYVTKFFNFLSINLVPMIDKTTKFFEQHQVALVALATFIGGALTAALVALGITFYINILLPLAAFGAAIGIFALWGAAIVGVAALVYMEWSKISPVIKTLQNDFSQLFDYLVTGVKEFANIAMPILKPITDLMAKVFPSQKPTAQATQPNLQQQVEGPTLPGKGFEGPPSPVDGPPVPNQQNVTLWQKAFADIQNSAVQFGNYMKTQFTSQLQASFNTAKRDGIIFWDFMVIGFEGLKEAGGGFADWWKNTFHTSMQQSFQNTLKDFLVLTTGIGIDWGGIWKELPKPMTGFLTAVGNFLVNMGKQFSTFFTHMLDGVVGFLNKAIDNLNSFAGKVPGYVKIPDIKMNEVFNMFASGTNFAPGGLAIVGENGPELVNLPRGSQVIPNSQISHYNSGGNVTIQNVNLNNQMDIDTMMRKISYNMKYNSAI